MNKKIKRTIFVQVIFFVLLISFVMVGEIAIAESTFDRVYAQMQNDYPEGMTWTNANSAGQSWASWGCWAYANIFGERLFGSIPARDWGFHTDRSRIVVGDVISTDYTNSAGATVYGHTMVVVAINGDTLTIAEGNGSGGKIHYGRTFGRYAYSLRVYHAPNYDEVMNSSVDVSFDVNFTVNGTNKEYIAGIGEISVVVGGETMKYQDKQHSSATTSYSDFCKMVPGGKEYEVRVNITDPNYYCTGATQGKMIGTTSSNIVVNLNITSTKPSRVLPDGDYLIAAAATNDKTSFFYLDIEGTAKPAANETNVALCGPMTGNTLTNIPEYEIWTLKYGSDGFYTIKQKGTNMALDVYGASTAARANVSVHQGNDSNAQKWAITRNGSNGYRLQARCSAMYLDIKGAAINTSGTNVMQYPNNGGNGTTSQAWLFIPYKPSQPINAGEYVILYTADQAHEVDLPGDTGTLDNGTTVSIWTDTANSKYNTYAFTKLSNGYYKIKHVESGKCLEVPKGPSEYKSKVGIHEDNGSIAQQWAIVPNGTGYNLISRCNGYYLDLPNGTTTNGTGIEVYPWMNNTHQRWSFVKAKYTISYNINGGSGTIPNQIKYYKSNLTLSSTTPSRTNHTFLGWSTSASATTAEYSAGGTFTNDEDTTLYAVWKANSYTLSYNGNGGSPVPESQSSAEATITIPANIVPTRPHYHFLGWAESATATTAQYAPGDKFIKGVTTTLYAVWERNRENIFTLPAFLTEIEKEAFLNTNADVIIIPATISKIGENAFGDVVIYGYKGTAAETYANNHHLTFVPLTDNWVLASDVPDGAHITDNKWTYTLTTTDTTTSMASSMEGWTQASYEWQRTGTGNWRYASYPSGFDTGSSLYKKYNKTALTAGEQSTGENTKRVVDSESTFVTYIYWHWTFVDSLNSASDNHNVLVEDAKKYNVLTGNVYRDYIYFDAFEDTVDHGTVGPGKSGMIDVAPMRYAWRNVLGDVSHWWWIFEVKQQTYTDYQKLFTYVKDESELLESSTEITAGDGISNIQHWVKYEF